jgi:hypothetical protein
VVHLPGCESSRRDFNCLAVERTCEFLVLASK